MSTELPSPRKLNVEPATAEEIRAKYNTEANEDGTYDDATYEGQLAQEEEAGLTRAQQMRRLLTIGSATLGVGLTAMVGANLMGNAAAEKGPGVQPESTSSADATPGTNETTAPITSTEQPSPLASPANTVPLETAKPVEATPSLVLSVEKYADKDTLAKAIVEDRINAWHMAGATKEKQESYYTRPEPWTQAEFATEAEKESTPYIESLFTSDWSSRPGTVKFIQRMKDMNAQTMYLNAATGEFSSDPDNVEAYAIDLNVTSVNELTSTDGNRLLEITFNIEDNSERNTAMQAVNGTIEKANATWQLELKQEGGIYKIANAAL